MGMQGLSECLVPTSFLYPLPALHPCSNNLDPHCPGPIHVIDSPSSALQTQKLDGCVNEQIAS